jgi:hypothetical protein
MNSVMIVGLGDIGEHALELLCRSPEISHIYTADINEEASLRKIYSARAGAAHQGFYPFIEFEKVDLNDIDATASYIERVNPGVIISAVTLLTWWAPEAAAKNIDFQKLDEAGFGAWLPLHITLTYKLMKAVKKAEISSPVVNCSFPDAINHILGKVGLAPTVGIGNCDLFVPEIQKIVADIFQVAMKSVSVYLVGHHYLCHVLNSYRSTLETPYYLRVVVDWKDVTEKLDADDLLVRANTYMPKGVQDHFIVAASAIKDALHLLNDTQELTYAPGPMGLPGGYPVRIGGGKAQVELPEDITLEDAVRINEESQRRDGIEKVLDNGTVVFPKKTVEIMDEILGYHCESMTLEESGERAKELLAAYKKTLSG